MEEYKTNTDILISNINKLNIAESQIINVYNLFVKIFYYNNHSRLNNNLKTNNTIYLITNKYKEALDFNNIIKQDKLESNIVNKVNFNNEYIVYIKTLNSLDQIINKTIIIVTNLNLYIILLNEKSLCNYKILKKLKLNLSISLNKNDVFFCYYRNLSKDIHDLYDIVFIHNYNIYYNNLNNHLLLSLEQININKFISKFISNTLFDKDYFIKYSNVVKIECNIYSNDIVYILTSKGLLFCYSIEIKEIVNIINLSNVFSNIILNTINSNEDTLFKKNNLNLNHNCFNYFIQSQKGIIFDYLCIHNNKNYLMLLYSTDEDNYSFCFNKVKILFNIEIISQKINICLKYSEFNCNNKYNRVLSINENNNNSYDKLIMFEYYKCIDIISTIAIISIGYFICSLTTNKSISIYILNKKLKFVSIISIYINKLFKSNEIVLKLDIKHFNINKKEYKIFLYVTTNYKTIIYEFINVNNNDVKEYLKKRHENKANIQYIYKNISNKIKGYLEQNIIDNLEEVNYLFINDVCLIIQFKELIFNASIINLTFRNYMSNCLNQSDIKDNNNNNNNNSLYLYNYIKSKFDLKEELINDVNYLANILFKNQIEEFETILNNIIRTSINKLEEEKIYSNKLDNILTYLNSNYNEIYN